MSLESFSPDILAAFSESVSWVAITAGSAGVIAGGAAFVGLFVPSVSRLVLPPPQETRLADNLPFDQILPDGKTLLCRDGTIAQCVEVIGQDGTFLTANEQQLLFLSRKDWIDATGETGVTMRVFVIRDKTDVTPPTEHENPVLREIAHRWNESFRKSYRNRHIIVLSLPSRDKNSLAKLNEVVETTCSVLHDYGPYVLVQDDEDPEYRPLAVFGRIASPISRPMPGGTGIGVSQAITADQVIFGGDSGRIEFSSGDKKLYCSTIGFRTLGDYTYEAFVSDITAIDGEIVLHHYVEPYTKTRAALKITREGRMMLGARFSPSVAVQFDEAMDMIEGNDENAQILTDYAINAFVYGDTLEEVQEREKDIRRIASNYGITAVREAGTAQASWFCQFPSFQIFPRQYKFFSRNVASHITLDRPPTGIFKSAWGEGPIALFRTVAGTPYSFQFHVSPEPAAVAHAVAIGPTGGGKTTMITFLAGMAMRHSSLRVYMIDRHGGAYIFTNAVGGNYVTFEGSDLKGSESALNPFQCDDTPENRSFLRAFLQALSELDDPDTVEEIGFAIEAAFDTPGLPRDRRSLEAIYDAAFARNKPLRKALHKWVDPAVHGKLFNSPRDSLDLTSTRIVTFDFTRLYEHEDMARAVIMYLMHRIQNAMSVTRSPSLIFIDETEPVVRHPMFRTYFLQMLQEFRKRNAAVISAFQRPEAITQAGLGEAIRGQAQTSFFFPNPQAQEREYADWGLTDREWAYIKGRLNVSRRLRRSVLVRRATGESVILDTDLSPLGPMLRVFFSDDPSKGMAMDMMDRYGPDWLAHYLNMA